MKCLQLLFLGFNLLLFLMGLIMLSIGIWLSVDDNSAFNMIKMGLNNAQENQMQNTIDKIGIMQSAVYLVIASGVFLVLVGFSGCCGVAKNSKLLLRLFLAITSILLILEISGMILGIVFKTKLGSSFSKNLKNSLTNNYIGYLTRTHNESIISKVFDQAMISIKCCGIDGKEDFNNSNSWQESKKFLRYTINNYTVINGCDYKIPPACCMFKSTNVITKRNEVGSLMTNPRCPVNEKDFYESGCLTKVLSVANRYKLYIILSMVAFLVLQIIQIACACLILKG